MTKEQAIQTLINLINSLKLTKQEYDTLTHALHVATNDKPLIAEKK